MKLSVIANEIGAKLYGEDINLPSIQIDSRQIHGTELFVALKGENHDGHDFISEAIAKGAAAVLAHREPHSTEKACSFLQVKDTTKALGQIASFWRTLYPVPLIGVTGSCGKTTVKGMLAAICQEAGKTLSTKGNLNNQFGLPLTLLQLDNSYEYAVIEMGASQIGDIQALGKIAKPDVALITNVNAAHLQGFGSLANVAKAKGEIYESLSSHGVAVLNIDEPYGQEWRTLIGERETITFSSREEKADVYAHNINLQPFHVEFDLVIQNQSFPVKIEIPGEHTVMNALASAAGAFALGISLNNIVLGLSKFKGVPGRLSRSQGLHNAIIIDDSYNANPGSVNAALKVLASCPGEKWFVLGDMAELGEGAIAYHETVGKTAKECGIDRLFAVGKLSEYAVKAFGHGATFYLDKETLIEALKSNLGSQIVILVKGSRSSGMEIISNALALNKD